MVEPHFSNEIGFLEKGVCVYVCLFFQRFRFAFSLFLCKAVRSFFGDKWEGKGGCLVTAVCSHDMI